MSDKTRRGVVGWSSLRGEGARIPAIVLGRWPSHPELPFDWKFRFEEAIERVSPILDCIRWKKIARKGCKAGGDP
jgi:hypothetical protein